jgi:DNA-directed RNA polymerase specialized sigma24 family protein
MFVDALHLPGMSLESKVQWLRKRARRFQADEIRQEIILAILTCAMEKPSFFGHFERILARGMMQLIGSWDDPLPLDEDRLEARPEVIPLSHILDDDEVALVQMWVDSSENMTWCATQLGIPRTTFRRRLRKALEKITEELDEDRWY